MNPAPIERRGFLAGLAAGLGGLLGLGWPKAKAGWRSTWRREEFAGAKLDPAGFRIESFTGRDVMWEVEIPKPTVAVDFGAEPPTIISVTPDGCIRWSEPCVRPFPPGDSPREA